ncbi:MAG: FlgD immunoglobulin-like domain containing protein [Candidatus Cloacimonadota bacterium]|nr:FlgD immunoglobulin-like domain containing protein [Candidatus Cloacimonadota bacterium]
MKRQNLNANLSETYKQFGMLKWKILYLFLVALLLSTQLFAENWMQLYPEIDGPVADMEFSEIPGISEYGLIFAIADSGGGLGYFDSPGNFSIFNIATNLGAVSVAPDNANNRIFCAFGCGSYSDGLYEFDVATHQFELIEWAFNPNFVEKLASGYYFGFGWDWFGGLFHSVDGDNWASIDYFNNKVVRDIEETSDGTLFVAAGNEICIANDTTFSSFDTDLPVNDIYVCHYPTEEVFIACGDGTDSDGIYKVEYEDGEITGLTLINWAIYPNEIYEYTDWLVVGCLNSEGLWLVEPVEMGEIHQIGTELDFEDVYCFETYPIYCHNIMVGTDNGVYLGTNLEPGPCNISVFEAHWNSSDNVSIIHWRTESETDVIGFYIYRNDEPDFSTAELISGLIPGHGTTTEPHDYYFIDVGIVPYPMDEYWYWLESVDFGGEFHIYGPTNLLIPNCVLSIFVAQYLDNTPTLYWITQSETDNLGWNIYRSINDGLFASAEMINIGLIPGYGTTTEPHSYIYEDPDLEANSGDIIWYWLESIDFGGVSYIYYPPASLVIPEIGIDERPAHSSGVVLYQNFPNPFSPRFNRGSTMISFNLATKSHKKALIKIYNVKGQIVKQLSIVNCQSSIEWDGKDENGKLLSNGIYFYRLTVDDKIIDTKKCVILR